MSGKGKLPTTLIKMGLSKSYEYIYVFSHGKYIWWCRASQKL